MAYGKSAEEQFIILLQNLLNRATDIEMHNAQLGQREVSMEKIEENLKVFGTLAMKKINTFKKSQVKSTTTIQVK